LVTESRIARRTIAGSNSDNFCARSAMKSSP
jgi:hypothetical protein